MLEWFVDSDDKIHKVATRGLRAVKNTGTLADKTNRNRIEPRGGGMVVKEIVRKLRPGPWKSDCSCGAGAE